MSPRTLGVAHLPVAWYRPPTMRIRTSNGGVGMGDHEGMR